jgi:predicted dehydrogenase
MQAFVERVLGAPVEIADAEQGYRIQQLVAAIYRAAELGTGIDL